jgi:hypothetical protein
MAFKMKGFSGFGNSPVKQVKPLVNPKFKKFQEEKKQTRTVKTIKRDKPKTVKPEKGLKLETVKRRPNIHGYTLKKDNIGKIKQTIKNTLDQGKKEFTKQVRRNINRPTRGQVISAIINPFDIKNKIKTAKHYGPKIKKFLDTPVKKRK